MKYLGRHRVSSSRSCSSRSGTPAEDAGDNREEDGSNHREPSQGDARGDGEAAKLLASVLHKGADVFLSRGDSMVQLQVKCRMGSPHGCQVFHSCVRISSLSKKKVVHLLLSSGVDVELLKPKMDFANVYCFI
jgi:hypothetical protein